MESFSIPALVIGTLVLVGLGVALALRPAQVPNAPELAGKRPQGYWMGVGIAGGMLVGYVLALIGGLLIDDMTSIVIFGPLFGVSIGVAIGAALEQQHKADIRPLTAAEQQMRRRAMWAGVALVVVGLLMLFGVFLLVG
ncbi:MAG: hypothetical protein HC828_05395 [Blastochloris sp.]|nr:hypothetical protein [Blastochloris sp.]